MTSRFASFIAVLTLCAGSLSTSAWAQSLGGPDSSGRSPRESAQQGLEWLGTLQPMFTTCHLAGSITQPFVDLEKLMAQVAQKRGIATAKETQAWVNAGAVDSQKQMAALASAGLTQSTCTNIQAEVTRQAPLVAATVTKLHQFILEHPESQSPQATKP